MGLISFLGSQVEMALTRFLTKMLKAMDSTSSLDSRVAMVWISSLVKTVEAMVWTSSLVKTVEAMVWTSSSGRPIILNILVRQVNTFQILMMFLPRKFPRMLFPKMILRRKKSATIRLENRKIILT